MRFAAVAPELPMMHGVANTLLGLTEKVIKVNLGAEYMTMEQMREKYPAPVEGEEMEPGDRLRALIKPGSGFTVHY